MEKQNNNLLKKEVGEERTNFLIVELKIHSHQYSSDIININKFFFLFHDS